MSLDTVIKIGKLYRQVPQSWQYHDQVNLAMTDAQNLLKKKDKVGNVIETRFLELPVIIQGDEMVFDFDHLKEITDEDKQKEIYYLNFKTSKKDAEKRYLFGDISYSSFINKKNEQEENGNYRMGTDKKVSSFFRCEEVAKTIDNIVIQQFRNAFRKDAVKIESLLTSAPSVVLHFSFNGERWLEFEGIVESIDSNLTNELVDATALQDKVVLSKYLYKTLGGATPGFTDDARHKNRLFIRDEIISLMYAGKAAEKPIIRINSVGILALPHADGLTPYDVVSFFERDKETVSNDKKIEEEEDKEDRLVAESENETEEVAADNRDTIFGNILDNDFDDKVKFDIVFTSVPASPAGVFYDLIEIANVEKSFLQKVKKNIDDAKKEIAILAQTQNPQFTKPLFFDVRNSFLKILGDVTKDKKKFQFHLLKVLPKIYSDSYYEDPVLLPAFIEKVEYNIRNGGQAFNTFKYDFYFLSKIQKNDMQITKTQSYALGQALGTMARPFAAWRDDCPIKSFEKSYVGNLTRKIASIEELTKFADYLNEKLVIHERAYKPEKEAFLSLVNIISTFKDEKYNKHYCSLGFFESYYQFNKKEENNLQTENAA